MTVNAAGSGNLIAAKGTSGIDGSKLEILANNGTGRSQPVILPSPKVPPCDGYAPLRR